VALFARIYIGTSGWNYDDWVGPFYTSPRGMFTQYARVFNTTEINSSFYSMPSPKFLRRLASYAPPGFVFSIKMYRGITHKGLLRPDAVEAELKAFLEAVDELKGAGKLGAVLVQMPPRSREEIPWFEDFLDMLPSGYRFAVEFRHPSWLADDVIDMLRRHGVAYTVVDEPLLPPVVYVTADFSYIRWHGRGQRPWYYYHYSEEELKEWVPRINKLSTQVETIYGYFNNHFRGYAPHNALQMLRLLGMANRKQREALRRIEEYFRRGEAERVAARAREALEAGGLEDILLALAGERRYRRGLEIPPEEVEYRVSGDIVEGRVKDYKVRIDLGAREIYHDCEDWKKISESRRICKHLVRFLTAIPRELAERIARDLAENLEEWEFRHP